ncbi:MAG TPA: MmgE/PrpD family protein [Casimicrobiaceae bacterium]
MTTAARTLARFASALRFEAIPELDRHRARQCVVDTVGISLLGSRLPWGIMAADYARRYGSNGTSRIIGSRDAIGAPLAALANGVLAHAFELDSLRKPGAGVHPGAALVPVALALGEETGCSGATLLTAIVAGCEVMFRIGAASKHSSERLGFHAPGLTGPFGAAVTAARVLDLDAERLTHALGIAGSLCGGSLAFAKAGNGAMVKRLHLGRAAEAGILAARLAERGFEGPDTILEGGYGFLETYCAESDPGLLTAGLGERFETGRLCIKRYPCHVTAHTPLLAIEAMRREHGFNGDDVANVLVRASAKVVSHHADREPADTMAAQYSVPYCVAVALRDDPMDPDAYGKRGLSDPSVRALCRSVRCEPLEDARGAWASEVTLTLNDGRALVRACDDFPGTPTVPLDDDQLAAKYRRCARGFAFAEHLLAQLMDLERLPDVRTLELA